MAQIPGIAKGSLNRFRGYKQLRMRTITAPGADLNAALIADLTPIYGSSQGRGVAGVMILIRNDSAATAYLTADIGELTSLLDIPVGETRLYGPYSHSDMPYLQVPVSPCPITFFIQGVPSLP